MRVLILVAVTGLGCAVALPTATAALGPGQTKPAAVATVLCLLPAVVTLRLVEWVARRAPEHGVVAVLLGIGLRMTVVVIGVVLLGDAIADPTARGRLVGWVVGMYLLTLTAESALAVSAVGSAAPPTPLTPAAGR